MHSSLSFLWKNVAWPETAYGAFQLAGEHRDYDFTSDEFRSSDVTIGDHRFEVVKMIALLLQNGNHCFLISSSRCSRAGPTALVGTNHCHIWVWDCQSHNDWLIPDWYMQVWRVKWSKLYVRTYLVESTFVHSICFYWFRFVDFMQLIFDY